MRESAAKRLGFAKARLAAARDLLARHPADALTRAYRAMTQAARATLAQEGVSATSEDDLFSRFRRIYGRTGGLDTGLARALGDARSAAHAIDEEDGVEGIAEKASWIVDFAGRLVEEVEKQLHARAAEESGRSATGSIERDLASKDLPPEKAAMLRELAVAFPGEPALIRKYIEIHGWGKVVSANVRAVRQAMAAAMPARAEEGEEGALAEGPASEGGDPFYGVVVRCFFCKSEAFETRTLRGKSLQIIFDYMNPAYPLFVPTCESPLRHYHAADPVLHEIHVCPHCLYASPNLGNFVTDDAYASSRGLIKHLATRKLDLLQQHYAETAPARAEMLSREAQVAPGAMSARFFGAGRTPAAARLAFRLAAECGRGEAEYNGNALLNAGKSLLAAARLSRDLGETTLEETFLQEALATIESAFERTSKAGEALYLASILQAHFGRKKEAKIGLSRVLTDRGRLPDATRFKRFAENLKEDLKHIEVQG